MDAGAGDDGHAEGTGRVHVTNNPQPLTKKQKRLARFIEKTVNGEDVTGVFKSVGTITIASNFTNQWSICTRDDMHQPLWFESPMQFKDAEAVLFNAKIPRANSWFTTTEYTTPGDGYNFKTMSPTHILNSSTYFKFTNQSQQRMILEMYIFRAKSTFIYGNNLEDAIKTYSNQSFRGRCYPDGYGGSNSLPFYYLGGSFNDVPGLDDQFDIEKIGFRMDPGEMCGHVVKGPRNYTLKGETKTVTGASGNPWKTPYYGPGNGYLVLFRTITDLALYSGGGTFAATNFNDPTDVLEDTTAFGKNRNLVANINVFPLHPKNKVGTDANAGAIVCEYTRRYRVRAPEAAPYAENQLVLANYIHEPVTDASAFTTKVTYRNPAFDTGN